MAIKSNFVLFERTSKVIYEDPLQRFRTLPGFRNILTKNSVQSAIWYYNWPISESSSEIRKTSKLVKTSSCTPKVLRKVSQNVVS
jgi:hypothetical protein